MPELSLARNAEAQRLTTNVGFEVDNAQDVCFVITQCTAFKVMGSVDDGSNYNDIEGSSSLLGAAGTLTAGTTYLLSLTQARFDHLKAVFSGTNPCVSVIRRYVRQSPVIGVDATEQVTIIDPETGTA